MRIVVDANTVSAVFNADNQAHAAFEPVRVCITEGPGEMVFGGGRYASEIGRLTQFLDLLSQLERASRLEILDDKEVDKEETALKRLILSSTFDDPHIIAIVIVGHCQVVCTCDRRSHKYYRMQSLYPKGFPRPKIYSGSNCKQLLASRVPKSDLKTKITNCIITKTTVKSRVHKRRK
jgi:hypothetical protein